MRYRILLAGFLLSLTVTDALPSLTNLLFSSSGEEDGKPSFCHDLDCPNFKVVRKTSEYEEREYVATSWVSTEYSSVLEEEPKGLMDTLYGMVFGSSSPIDDAYNKATYAMFMKLFKYISGANVKAEKIAMTAPVIGRIIPGQGPACETNFTMSFFIAPGVDAPQATDATVKLVKYPKFTVYVRSFGGWPPGPSLTDWLDNAAALAKALHDDGVAFKESYYYTAGYDPPYRVFGRHNEIWMLAGN